MRSSTRFKRFKKWLSQKQNWVKVLIGIIAAFLIICGILILWIATLRMPDLQSFQSQVLSGSTKIYDRTGNVLLYDLNQNEKQEVVPFNQISPYVKEATISIEDQNFYNDKGIEFSAILRAFFADLFSFSFKQGGSTITQQVVKNTLLTTDKSIARKVKEWVLALKLSREMSKDDILNLYLNSSPYGGTFYGVEEASENYFGIKAADLDVAEAAYLAALPQSPTYYSPYGSHKADLDARKNTVLLKMNQLGYITTDQYNKAKAEVVTFEPQQVHNIKAPHFVMFIKNYLVQKYGEDMVDNGGLKVITTLDYTMQESAETIVKKYALSNTTNYNATNASLVAIDPNTGQILTMVGSRDYFDKTIDGQFNVAVSGQRQPGSAFKPFAYVTAFEKGYTPDTVLFDVPTQFSTDCDAVGKPLVPNANCYMPQNYDNNFRGPMSMRNAISQSINIPSIKTFYLAGEQDTLQTAEDLGITTLSDIGHYGLTLVLGGGEVTPLEMTSAYGVFATNGIRNPYTGILSVTDRNGNSLEQFTANPKQELPLQPVLELNDVLHDNVARLPLNGAGSATDFPNREVALKTGTTNDSRDAWIVGYTPQLVVGAWAGNNDNSPMVHKTSGLIVAPLWRAFMDEQLAALPVVTFVRPDPVDQSIKPVLRGIWQGNQTYFIDTTTGNAATDNTPLVDKKEIAVPNVHDILYWVNRSDPNGPVPTNPASDPQYNLWEPPVEAWAAAHASQIGGSALPSTTPTVVAHNPISAVLITNPTQGQKFNSSDTVNVGIAYQSNTTITKAELYVNGTLADSSTAAPFDMSFIPKSVSSSKTSNDLKVIIYDATNNQASAHVEVSVSQ